jgi:hypothetical protein
MSYSANIDYGSFSNHHFCSCPTCFQTLFSLVLDWIGEPIKNKYHFIIAAPASILLLSVNLLRNIGNWNSMPNWLEIQKLIPTSTLTDTQLKFAQAHDSTFYKIRYADYHLGILDQIYRPRMTDSETNTKNWARAEMHSIVFNLYSALDSLGYEINLAYQFRIKPSDIHIHHEHNTWKKNCLRCEMDKQNDNVTSSIHCRLGLGWFKRFHKLRNQITHKHLPVLLSSITMGPGGTIILKIPNDPTESNPKQSDYSDNLELKQYLVDARTEVVKTIENIYPLIQHRISSILV